MSSITDFIFGKKLRIAVGELGLEYIDLDCTDSEKYEHDSVVSENPIEGGKNTTDHVRVLPVRLTIEGLVSNHATSRTLVNLDFTRAEDCYVLLQDWQNTAQRLTLTTSLDEYEDLLLKQFTVTRDKESANSLQVTMTFQQIQIVESQTSNVQPAIKAAKAKKVAAKRAKKEEKRTARLKAGLDAIKAYAGVN